MEIQKLFAIYFTVAFPINPLQQELSFLLIQYFSTTLSLIHKYESLKL